MKILDGKALASTLRAELKTNIQALPTSPCLHVILIGDNKASQTYIRNKQRACEEVGITCQVDTFQAKTPVAVIKAHLKALADDNNVHGLFIQLPLPTEHMAHLEAYTALIPPVKDVDGFHPLNVAATITGQEGQIPCTPHGVLQLITSCNVPAGSHVVIVGRSDIVGKPLSHLLLNKDYTVTVCHSKTHDLKKHTLHADVLVSAVGRAEFITSDMVKPGAVVIDVGINFKGNKLCGDVAFDEVSKVASAITPVPGGVGPMTVAYLLHNVLYAYLNR